MPATTAGKELALLSRSVTNLRASADASQGNNKREVLGDYCLNGIECVLFLLCSLSNVFSYYRGTTSARCSAITPWTKL